MSGSDFLTSNQSGEESRRGEESRFEDWFQQRRRRTWERSRVDGDPLEPRPDWSMGLRRLLRDAWMARAERDGAPAVPTTCRPRLVWVHAERAACPQKECSDPAQCVEFNACMGWTEIRLAAEKRVAGVAPAQRHDDSRWLVASGPDGYHTRIVAGVEAMERAYMEAHFGPTRPADECSPREVEEMEGMLSRLRNDDHWDTMGGERIRHQIDHEDGWVYVMRLTDETPAERKP